MLLSIIIVGFILGLGLYDYFSNRSWQMITSDERNETVFEKRNKKYGAYQIRKDYNQRMILILLGIVAGTSGLYAASKVFNRDEVKKVDVYVPIDNIADNDVNKKDEVVEKKDDSPKTDQKLAQAETYKFVPFTPTDKKVDTDIQPADPTKQAGAEDKKGTDPLGGTDPDPKDEKETEKKEIVDENGVPLTITEVAYFVGGKKKMFEFIADNIRQEVEGTGTTKLKFLVGKDGAIMKVWVMEKNTDCDGCDEAAVAVVKKMPNWVPGKNNGTPVNSYFYLPITFK